MTHAHRNGRVVAKHGGTGSTGSCNRSLRDTMSASLRLLLMETADVDSIEIGQPGLAETEALYLAAPERRTLLLVVDRATCCISGSLVFSLPVPSA